MICSMCGADEPEEIWIVVTVLEDDPVGGLICSTSCLIGFTAQVAALDGGQE